jgi:hypothetical protein
MPSDRSDDEPIPLRPPAPRDAEGALRTMAHDARNGLATIVARAQLLARRLRRGGPVEPERIAHGLSEIERVAKRTAARVDEIEAGVNSWRRGRRGRGPLADESDHGNSGGP